jgi:hypothetical protein
MFVKASWRLPQVVLRLAISGGITESRITLRIPWGCSRMEMRAMPVPPDVPYTFHWRIPSAVRRSAKSAAFSVVL